MRNKYIAAFVTAMVIVVGLDSFSDSHQLHSNTQGAPSANACTSCHGGSAINSGSGNASVAITGNPTGYVPGQTYEVKVTVATAGRSKFGFALSADNGSGAPRGSFATAGNTTVQVVNNYVTHTSGGVSGTGTKTWAFNWTAPSAAQGTVRFLAYGNATNSSNSDNGDLIYSAITTLAPATTGISEATPLGGVDVFPNPVVQHRFNLALDLKEEGNLHVRLLNRTGAEVQQIFSKQAERGALVIPAELNQSLPSGIYYLLVEQNGHTAVKNLFIQ